MIQQSLRYLTASTEYCEVNVAGAFINMELIIRNREQVPCSLFGKNVWDISKLLIGNRESGTGN